ALSRTPEVHIAQPIAAILLPVVKLVVLMCLCIAQLGVSKELRNASLYFAVKLIPFKFVTLRMPFIEYIKEVPSFVKYVKEFLTKKRAIDEAVVPITHR
ncbi:hypothetical protein HAX54_039069, partial [Datura stramonium]|nr:hypothetical protein [Datura stramonium]